MTTRHRDILAALLIAVGTAGVSHAATTYTYTYNYNFTVNSGCTGTWYTSCGLTGTQTGSSVTPLPAPADPNAPPNTIGATATGWANTQGTANINLEQGQLQSWSGGLGVKHADGETDSSPQHATDNEGRLESILYSFNQAISLTQVNITWYQNDSDITVLAFTGGNFNVNSNLAGLSYASLLTNGWTLVGHYSNLHQNGNKTTVNTGISSSYWLIGAANSLGQSGSGLDSSLDYVKIGALAATVTTQFTPPPPPTGVPEPGTLALFGLGALMLARARRR